MPRGHVISDGRKVAALRGEADLTQWQLAKEAGYGLRTIGKIENGQPTGAGTLAAVATVLSRRLKRPVELGDLMQHTNGTALLPHGAEPRMVEEAVKFLDLTALASGAAGQQRSCSGKPGGLIRPLPFPRAAARFAGRHFPVRHDGQTD